MSPAKMAEPRDAAWVEDLGAQRTMYQMGHPDPPMGRGNFNGEGRPIVRYRDTLQ